jgi:hypothetical protein
MAQINTVIVLRNDQSTAWETSDCVMLKGEVGISYLDNGNVIAKLGDGYNTWKDLPQIEGVFEDEFTLTHNFGRYKTSNGFVKTTDAKGKTTSQWLVHALSETKEPTITQPTFTLTVGATGKNGEIGSYITALTWDGTTTYGKYEYGPATGLSATNRTWAISNSVDNQTSNKEDGTFSLISDKYIQLTQETEKTYATITAAYTLDASGAADPVNNVGATTTGKITDKSGTITKEIKSTAYRRPFYGVLAPSNMVEIESLTSDVFRNGYRDGIFSAGTATRGLPGSITVDKGAQMVIFAAKAGTYSSLSAIDELANKATVSFEKKINAVKIKGDNNFVTADAPDGVDYDIWYVIWPEPIKAAKQLTLTWN